MQVYIDKDAHINKSVLPLRFGISITQTHQTEGIIKKAQFDKKDTDMQKAWERKRGRKVYRGTLVFKKVNEKEGSHYCKGKFAIEPQKKGNGCKKVVTALRLDIEKLEDNNTITKHLEGMLKREQVSTDEIIKFLHPAYLDGKIRDSNCLEDVLRETVAPSQPKSGLPKSASDQAIIESGPTITKTANEIDVDYDEDEEDIKPLVFKKLNLKPSIKYDYVMADAHVLDAGQGNNYIWVKVINSKGVEQELQSFLVREHLSHHHDRALEYFKSRIGGRAFMAICVSEEFKGVLAESVTSIALDLMRG